MLDKCHWQMLCLDTLDAILLHTVLNNVLMNESTTDRVDYYTVQPVLINVVVVQSSTNKSLYGPFVVIGSQFFVSLCCLLSTDTSFSLQTADGIERLFKNFGCSLHMKIINTVSKNKFSLLQVLLSRSVSLPGWYVTWWLITALMCFCCCVLCV